MEKGSQYALSHQPTLRPFIRPNSTRFRRGPFFFFPASDQRRRQVPRILRAMAAADEAAAVERVQCDDKKNSRKPEGLRL